MKGISSHFAGGITWTRPGPRLTDRSFAGTCGWSTALSRGVRMQSPEYRRLVRLAAGYNRKARTYGLRGRITADELLMVEMTHSECAYCGIALEIGHGSFDHIKAFDAGGENDITNIARCCMTCQRRKFTKSPDEYAQHQELTVQCSVCGSSFQPRWAEYKRGMGKVCSRSCAAKSRWSS